MTDRPLDIATGNSRRTKVWKNKKTTWPELLARLQSTTRTPETVAEYKAMSRDEQSRVKDVGGFVGGYCNHGSRSDIRFRSILCLDADYADAEVWPDWGLLYGNAAAIYSTHKHTDDKPRLRLVVPLARDVTPDEYQAIGRRVAATLGVDKFDDTSYQPQRMMYWPSTSQDGAYVYDALDGAWLDPDAVLSTYHNWRDVSSWPMSSRVAEIATRPATKQQDPTTKGGLVGAWCRAYTIHDAIEAHVPEYTACDDPGRYTYAHGSTAAGVVTYNGLYSYSHHATDPASGQLCNAWDLVRLHKFGELDADCDPDTKTTNRPSYKAMAQFAAADDRCRVQLVAERAQDFDSPPDAGVDWRAKLRITEKGGIAQTIENVVLILENDPALAGRLAYNEMQQNVEALTDLPWRPSSGSQWTDADDAALRYHLEKAYGITSKDKIFDAVNVVANNHAYHPVRQYLDACTWDDVPRVETLLIDYLGAEDTPYTRAVTRKTMAAAVARIYRPGCKFDYLLTLRGAQGIGKSSLFARLAGGWFSDTFSLLHGKEAYEQALGVWIIEISELATMRKADVETVKMYLSKQVDRFRPAYGRRIQEFPRRCVFIGTTNETQFLRDATGNRRFWVVDTPNKPTLDIWDDLTPDKARLIWAEAVEIYKTGEELYLSRDLEEAARGVQRSYEEENPKAGMVEAYINRLLPETWGDMDTYDRRQWLESEAEGTVQRQRVCAMELFIEVMGGRKDALDRYEVRELRDIMTRMPGWKAGKGQKTFKPYGRQQFFERVDT